MSLSGVLGNWLGTPWREGQTPVNRRCGMNVVASCEGGTEQPRRGETVYDIQRDVHKAHKDVCLFIMI